MTASRHTAEASLQQPHQQHDEQEEHQHLPSRGHGLCGGIALGLVRPGTVLAGSFLVRAGAAARAAFAQLPAATAFVYDMCAALAANWAAVTEIRAAHESFWRGARALARDTAAFSGGSGQQGRRVLGGRRVGSAWLLLVKRRHHLCQRLGEAGDGLGGARHLAC